MAVLLLQRMQPACSPFPIIMQRVPLVHKVNGAGTVSPIQKGYKETEGLKPIIWTAVMYSTWCNGIARSKIKRAIISARTCNRLHLANIGLEITKSDGSPYKPGDVKISGKHWICGREKSIPCSPLKIIPWKWWRTATRTRMPGRKDHFTLIEKGKISVRAAAALSNRQLGRYG